MLMAPGRKSEFTMDDRLRWHYAVALLADRPLTDGDRQRLDDLEWLLENR